MAFKAKLIPLLDLFLFSLFLLSSAATSSFAAYERDPQQELEKCRQLCQRQPLFLQQQCEQQCDEQYKERQREEGGGRGIINTRDPQQEYQQCQRQCRQQEKGQQQQRQCEQRCEERRKEQEREQGRDEQDPQREYQQCRRQCQKEERGQQQQRQCEQRCEERRKEQEREQGRDEQDPQKEYQQCRRQCQQEERGQQQQRQCEQRCEERRKEQEREQGRDEQDPQREYQQCRRQCQQEERGQQQQRQCEQRCEERRKEQEREQGRDEQDPQKEYQQCRRQCQQEERGQQQQRQCEQRCEERRKEQEREQGRDEQDPQKEYQQCRRQCQQQERGQQQQRQCEQRCEERRKEQEREQGRDERDPQREYQQCQHQCQQEERGQQQQQQCEQRCEERRKEQEGEQQHQGGGYRSNPYFFDEQSFRDRYRTQEGSIRVLPRFTERSNLLRGIENSRLEIYEANPNTFAVPSHWDADAVIYVVKGRGTISLVRQQNRDSYNIKQGDVLRVPAGSLVYLINRDSHERLQIATLLQPVSTPGQFKEFVSAAGEERDQSFYRTFSTDILETAFNTPREKLDRLFGQQRKGVIIRASQEQIRELARHASSSSEGGHHLWPRGGSHQSSQGGPYNLLNKHPSQGNNYGQLYEVDGNDYRQLQDLDISVSFANISQGAMLGPFFNSRATKVILVVEGRGRFEMACPHLSRQSQQQHQRPGRQGREEQEQEEEEEGGASYQRVSARLSPRTAFVVPAGHPVAIVASQNENLQIVGFGINAQDNQRNFLAGRESVINQIEKEAMELGFNVEASEVKETLSKQKESYFFPGPKQHQQREEKGSLSILDFVGF